MTFREGDSVKYLDETGGGIILKIKGKTAVVFDDEGFEQTYPLAKLVLNEPFDPWNDPYDAKLPKELTSSPPSKPPSKIPASRSNFKNSIFEVDLHIEELVDSFNKLSNGEIIQIQLAYFEKKLAWGFRKRLKKMIFIHGVGQGVLKNEIRSRLNAYDFADFHDASYRRYGYGATEVVFRYH